MAPLTRWFRANRARVADPLAWDDALDRLRRDPACGACRDRLRGLVWRALPTPPVGAARRDGAGRAGRAIWMRWRAGAPMNPWALPLILAVAVVLAWLRLGWRQWRAPGAARSRGWRLALLLLAQPVLAALLYLTLSPPQTRMAEPETLTILTRGGSVAGGRTVALPEAARRGGIEQAPDLATALRRHPGIRALRIRGEGLTERDRPAARGLAIAFDPAPLPPGLIAMTPPDRTAPGGPFRVSGQVVGGGSVALLDPAGWRSRRPPSMPKGISRWTPPRGCPARRCSACEAAVRAGWSPPSWPCPSGPPPSRGYA
ncbi:hypothetical protein P0F65_14025 [Sphingomonas sp. I4]